MSAPSGAAVTCLAWGGEESLYVGYADGSLAELPLPTDVDTSETYELAYTGVAYDATPILESRRAAAKAEKERLKALEPKADAPPAEEADALGVMPGSAEAEEAPPEEEEEADVDAGGVLSILPIGRNSRAFYIGFEKEGGLLWKCAGSAVETVSRHDAPICSLAFSRSGQYMLSGGSDGSVCLSDAEQPKQYWQGRVHGASPKVFAQLSFDDAYVLSAGADGNLFVHKMATTDAKEAILSAISLPNLADAGALAAGAVDITDGATYSIEEAKQRQEADAKKALAESKKMTVREKVDALRKRFTGLLAENAKLAPAERLPRSAFYVDPGLQESTLKETDARLEEAQAEMAFDTEKIALKRDKVLRRSHTRLRLLAGIARSRRHDGCVALVVCRPACVGACSVLDARAHTC